jgi:hypothetical protein
MAGAKTRASCRESFKKVSLPLASKFLLSLLSFVVNNMENFQNNSHIHSKSTRYRYNPLFQILTSGNIKKEFPILELSYSINFQQISKVEIMI